MDQIAQALWVSANPWREMRSRNFPDLNPSRPDYSDKHVNAVIRDLALLWDMSEFQLLDEVTGSVDKRRASLSPGSRDPQTQCEWFTQRGPRCSWMVPARTSWVPSLCEQHHDAYVRSIHSWVGNDAGLGELVDLLREVWEALRSRHAHSLPPHVADEIRGIFGVKTDAMEAIRELWRDAS